MSIDTTFLRRCIGVLEIAREDLDTNVSPDDFRYDICRAACVK